VFKGRFINRLSFPSSLMTDNKEYEKLLKQAYDNMPESVFEKERFEIPKAMGHLQGNKTVIANFLKIVTVLGRESAHVLKYLLKELATPGEVRRGELILGTKITASLFNNKVRQYAEEYVLCSDCGKPDTKLIKEGDILYMKCQACGAKHYVKSRI